MVLLSAFLKTNDLTPHYTRYYKTLDDFDHGLNTVASVAGFYVAGVAVKILYYTCCHPSKLQNGYVGIQLDMV